jgi:hypothetical protein
MKARNLLVVGATLLLPIWATSVSADVIFTLGNNPQLDENNILFATGETGTTIVGEVDHSGVAVDFTSTQTLFQNAQGQASITEVNGDPLTNITVSVPGYTFGDFILNLQNGTGTATVTVTDNFNDVFMYPLGNGQNFLTITTQPSTVPGPTFGLPETIASVSVQMSTGGGFDVFKQPRISEVCNTSTSECVPVIPPNAVPEPGIVSLVALGLLGLGATARRRKTKQ